MKKLSIVSVAAEVAPFSKAGGLGDVARSLPKALKRLGHAVTVITPLHGVIDQKKYNLAHVQKNVELHIDESTTTSFDYYKTYLMPGLPVYFIDKPNLFSKHKTIYESRNPNERFYFFNAAALKLMTLLGHAPDVIQCHDWHTGLIPYFLKKRQNKNPFFSKTAVVYTIHNLAYQGGRGKDDGYSRIPRFQSKQNIPFINFAKRGILNADLINTVSEQYAKEILTTKYGEGLYRILRNRENRLFGIVNGIDYNVFNPEKDPYIYKHYSVTTLAKKKENKKCLQKEARLPVRDDIPLLGIVSRIAEQKGFDLLIKSAETLLRSLDVQLIVVGSGDKKYERFLEKLDKKHASVHANLKFDVALASKIYAGSDIFLMPSRFEPCGLGQLISLRYGSVPVVRHVGGLVNTVTDYSDGSGNGNGFVFKNYDPDEMLIAITRAVETYRHKHAWEKLVQFGMRQSHSWEIPAQKYVELFKKAIAYKK